MWRFLLYGPVQCPPGAWLTFLHAHFGRFAHVFCFSFAAIWAALMFLWQKVSSSSSLVPEIGRLAQVLEAVFRPGAPTEEDEGEGGGANNAACARVVG